MDTSQIPSDFKEFLKLLNENEVASLNQSDENDFNLILLVSI